ncbi:phosphatidate cytidylyltransferase [Loktanella sp. D2R18]|uniref:phosphatidate cytidylyltransferase n=1 Tax=Rhodobacterales TaxID=204455 RepID=UPI000DEB6FA6|nr:MULTISPECIES: phosphatidate cytidylyltransferase [Rhodobacterales]MDO6589574.1 phosphatidate cytidylyltransferase [Yoonia sp. 1_MG-2023]RBW44214.1 phosphatidate cytidylyltransferase [Loktanella sp. D2R18]
MASNWDDLKPRVLSAIAMTIIGAAGVIMGGVWFQMLVVFVTAVMVWELWMMIRTDEPTKGMLLAALVASVLSGQIADGSAAGLLLFFVVPVIGATLIKKEQVTFFVFALAIQIAGWGLVHFRMDYGFVWLLWMMSVVIVTDVFGYFAGRMLGGPKFWPKISPKKTWSGTIAGWVGAGFVGYTFTLFTNAGLWIILISMVISFAGQMGDIGESALKRRMGVKDSSTLIPGHGGLFDRFDAVLGAALFLLLIASVFNVPGAAF